MYIFLRIVIWLLRAVSRGEDLTKSGERITDETLEKKEACVASITDLVYRIPHRQTLWGWKYMEWEGVIDKLPAFYRSISTSLSCRETPQHSAMYQENDSSISPQLIEKILDIYMCDLTADSQPEPSLGALTVW